MKKYFLALPIFVTIQSAEIGNYNKRESFPSLKTLAACAVLQTLDWKKDHIEEINRIATTPVEVCEILTNVLDAHFFTKLPYKNIESIDLNGAYGITKQITLDNNCQFTLIDINNFHQLKNLLILNDIEPNLEDALLSHDGSYVICLVNENNKKIVKIIDCSTKNCCIQFSLKNAKKIFPIDNTEWIRANCSHDENYYFSIDELVQIAAQENRNINAKDLHRIKKIYPTETPHTQVKNFFVTQYGIWLESYPQEYFQNFRQLDNELKNQSYILGSLDQSGTVLAAAKTSEKDSSIAFWNVHKKIIEMSFNFSLPISLKKLQWQSDNHTLLAYDDDGSIWKANLQMIEWKKLLDAKVDEKNKLLLKSECSKAEEKEKND